ncbi:hypothetical protein ACI65C_009048 [Semiaphis heraclei]
MSRNTTKRNLSASSPTQAGDNKSKIFFTPNRYAALSDVSDDQHEVFSPPPVELPSQQQRNAPPNNTESTPGPRFFKSFSSPPFMVSGGNTHPTLVKALLDLIDPSCIYFKSSSKYLIIYTDDAANFNLVADYLLGNQIRFHTYQPKISKPFSVYIRYLLPSTSIDDITTGLTEKGHETDELRHRFTPNVSEPPPKKVFSRSSSKPERTYANTADNISSTDPISVTLSRFISSLNSLITPLITLLHTVVNSLTTKSIISP